MVHSKRMEKIGEGEGRRKGEGVRVSPTQYAVCRVFLI